MKWEIAITIIKLILVGLVVKVGAWFVFNIDLSSWEVIKFVLVICVLLLIINAKITLEYN